MSDHSLDRLFDRLGERRVVAGGAFVVRGGEVADALLRVETGRVAAVDPTSEGIKVLETLHPGAVIGGRAILTGVPHRRSYLALRDTEVLAISAAALAKILKRRSESLAELARLSLAPMASAPAEVSSAAILGFVAVCESVPMRDVVETLATSMRGLGLKVAVLDASGGVLSPAALSALEAGHDFLLMAAERHEAEFTAFCGRQIDRLVLVAGAASPLPDAPTRFAAAAIQKHRLLDMIVLHPADQSRPAGGMRWLGCAPAVRLFNIRPGRTKDMDRLARIYGGRSIGLALSGGGARAYAHVGVLRALNELGLPVDTVAGVSMGAVVAAALAMEWPLDEIEQRLKKAFVVSSPLQDIALPLLALSRGAVVERRLDEHFGDVDIEDLWLPFACLSSDLTQGGARVFKTGSVSAALRATISLPGVLPPVVRGAHVLVDGALVQNLPAELVREQHDGPTIGVDVAGVAGLRPEDLHLKPSGLAWLTSGAWRKGPPIVSVLIRSATLQTERAATAARDALDILIEPMMDNIQLQDWKAFAPAVEAGYRATIAKAEPLEALTQPRP